MANINNWDLLEKESYFDLCIIGSGPAGTVLAQSLTKSNLKIAIIESGKNLFNWVTNQKTRGMASFEISGNADYPVSNTRGFLLGGTSNFWTGRCERFHQSDFDMHPYTPPGNPWPVTYNELEPFYYEAERLFKVRSGERSPFTPFRKNPYPLKSKLDISYLKNSFSKIGLTIDDSPTATPSKTIRFFKVQKEILPEVMNSPDITLFTGLTVTKLIVNDEKMITAAEAKLLDGTKKQIKAKVFVVASGGIASPRLLLLSQSEYFPNGIGNNYDRVGRGFNEHPAVNFYAQVPHSWQTLYPSNKIGRSHQLYNEYRKQGLGSVLPVIRQSWLLPHHNMPLKISRIPHNALAIIKRFIKATLYIGVVIEMKISDDNRVVLSKNKVDTFGDPLAHLILNYSDEDYRLLDKSRELVYKLYNQLGAKNIYEAQITFSRHHQGTCRMGDNPKTSVVDKNLKVHDISNLYIGGSEVFVTGGSMQPVMSIAALSLRLGDHLRKNFDAGVYNKENRYKGIKV